MCVGKPASHLGLCLEYDKGEGVGASQCRMAAAWMHAQLIALIACGARGERERAVCVCVCAISVYFMCACVRACAIVWVCAWVFCLCTCCGHN